MPVSCHFRDCKALLVTSLTHVRSAIASTRPLALPFILMFLSRRACVRALTYELYDRSIVPRSAEPTDTVGRQRDTERGQRYIDGGCGLAVRLLSVRHVRPAWLYTLLRLYHQSKCCSDISFLLSVYAAARYGTAAGRRRS